MSDDDGPGDSIDRSIKPQQVRRELDRLQRVADRFVARSGPTADTPPAVLPAIVTFDLQVVRSAIDRMSSTPPADQSRRTPSRAPPAVLTLAI